MPRNAVGRSRANHWPNFTPSDIIAIKRPYWNDSISRIPMSRIRSNTSLILSAVVWYTLTGVMGVSLHHHLGWHPVAGVSATRVVCHGPANCGIGLSCGGPSRFSMSASPKDGLAHESNLPSVVPDLRPATAAHQWSHCPICQFQVQPRASQAVLPCLCLSHVCWVHPLDPIQWVAFPPDFTWQSRAPPTV